MDPADEFFGRLDAILDREQADLSETKRQHHLVWDKYISTLSTAAIGFCFVALPLTQSSHIWLALAGILGFVSAIVLSGTGYLAADRGLQRWEEGHSVRRRQHDRVRRRVNQLKREIAQLDPNDQSSILDAQQRCDKDISEIYSEYNFEEEREVAKQNNIRITRCNRGRTYCFLFGIAAVTLFAFLNLGALPA